MDNRHEDASSGTDHAHQEANTSEPLIRNHTLVQRVRKLTLRGPFSDKRRAEREELRRARAREDSLSPRPRKDHLPKKIRELMLVSMSDWDFDEDLFAFIPRDPVPEIEQLLDAIMEIDPSEDVVLRIVGLESRALARARGYLSPSSSIVEVTPEV